MSFKQLVNSCSFLILLGICLPALAEDSPIPPEQRRSVEQTLLTFPEWFLVHSPAEYAQYVKAHPPHGFPFLGHVDQLWSSYASVMGEQWRAAYPANIGYHVMICVIAASTTIEYGLRSLYENTLGRISWALSGNQLTDEDRYAARVAQDYVEFIRREPWYLYDFGEKLQGLWSTTPMFGAGMLRKWERRYALTTEYATKALYGQIIKLATGQAYEPALMNTEVVAEHVPDQLPMGVTLLQRFGGDRVLLDMPRYYDFRIAATQLAKDGADIVDVAGNRSVILVSLWAKEGSKIQVKDGRILFRQMLITMPGYERQAWIVPVSELCALLRSASREYLIVEHVYDY